MSLQGVLKYIGNIYIYSYTLSDKSRTTLLRKAFITIIQTIMHNCILKCVVGCVVRQINFLKPNKRMTTRIR